MTEEKKPAEAKDQTLDVGKSDLYATLTKSDFKEKGLTEEGKVPVADAAVEEEELKEEDKPDPCDIEEWKQFKTRWDNIGVIHERLIHCGKALQEEDVLFHMQQLDNAKTFIGQARAEIEKAFAYESRALAAEIGTECPFKPSWIETPTDVRELPREPKERVFFHKEVDVDVEEEETKSE